MKTRIRTLAKPPKCFSKIIRLSHPWLARTKVYWIRRMWRMSMPASMLCKRHRCPKCRLWRRLPPNLRSSFLHTPLLEKIRCRICRWVRERRVARRTGHLSPPLESPSLVSTLMTSRMRMRSVMRAGTRVTLESVFLTQTRWTTWAVGSWET